MGRLIITIAFFSAILSAQQTQSKAVLTDVRVETTQNADRVIVVTDKPIENHTSFALPEFGLIVLYLHNTIDEWSPHQLEVKKGVIDNIQSLYEEKLENTKIRISVTELLPFEVTKRGNELILEIKNPLVNKEDQVIAKKEKVAVESNKGVVSEKAGKGAKSQVIAKKEKVIAESNKGVVSEKAGKGEEAQVIAKKEKVIAESNKEVISEKAGEGNESQVIAKKEKVIAESNKEIVSEKAGKGAKSQVIVKKEKVIAESNKEVISEKAVEEEGVYLLGPEDAMEIVIWEHPEFSTKVVIDPLGNIPFSFFGDIKVEGLTKEQLGEEIKNRVSKFIDDPKVLITIIEYRSKPLVLV